MKSKTRKKEKWVDDGRTIADMNIEGMPWNNTRRPPMEEGKPSPTPENQFSPKETRQVVLNALLAGLAIGAVFIGGAALFILFCVNVWFQ